MNSQYRASTEYENEGIETLNNKLKAQEDHRLDLQAISKGSTTMKITVLFGLYKHSIWRGRAKPKQPRHQHASPSVLLLKKT